MSRTTKERARDKIARFGRRAAEAIALLALLAAVSGGLIREAERDDGPDRDHENP